MRTVKRGLFITLLAAVFTLAAGKDAKAAAGSYITPEECYGICKEMGEQYGICPELLQAIAFTESSYNAAAVNGTCKGLMQINETYAAERMEKLGVTDLYDARSSVLMAADLIDELRAENSDLLYVLLHYSMRRKTAQQYYSAGKSTRYVDTVLERAAELERQHGK